MANEDAIVVTEPTEIEVNPTESTVSGSRGVSGPIVNNVGGKSETPSNLVNDNLDLVTSKEKLNAILIYKKDGSVFESKLPINPAHFGFTIQVFVDSLPAVQSATPNTLYILKVKNDGVLVGYRLFRFNKEKGAFEQFGCSPDLTLQDGLRQQVARVENGPQEQPEKVFNGLTVFNKEPKIQGLPLGEWIDKKAGGVTEQELHDYVKANPTLAGTEGALTGVEVGGVKYKVPQGTVVEANPTLEGTEAALEGLQVGSVKYAIPKELPTAPTVDGTYTLKCVVAEGVPTYSWVLDE